MEMTIALALGRRLLREHGLDDWRLIADDAKTRAGVCRFRTRTISLSRPLTLLHDEDLVRDTILHEIAHALVGPLHGHDATWRTTALRIGCSGERLVDPGAPRVVGDWRGTCPAGHETTRHRRPQRVVSCHRCHRTFSPHHIITWTYRGRAVAMSERYQSELESIRRRHNLPTAGAPLQLRDRPVLPTRPHPAVIAIGTTVRVLARGRLDGQLGDVEAVHETRCQVRVAGDLYLIPHHLLEVSDSLVG